jgi:hypothetical protein
MLSPLRHFMGMPRLNIGASGALVSAGRCHPNCRSKVARCHGRACRHQPSEVDLKPSVMIDVLGPGLFEPKLSVTARDLWPCAVEAGGGIIVSWPSSVRKVGDTSGRHHERAVSLADAERALAIKEAGLTEEDECQSRTGTSSIERRTARLR